MIALMLAPGLFRCRGSSVANCKGPNRKKDSFCLFPYCSPEQYEHRILSWKIRKQMTDPKVSRAA